MFFYPQSESWRSEQDYGQKMGSLLTSMKCTPSGETQFLEVAIFIQIKSLAAERQFLCTRMKVPGKLGVYRNECTQKREKPHQLGKMRGHHSWFLDLLSNKELVDFPLLENNTKFI
eukprot:Pompholyxophrys_punicea_v1_NODE_243_length_2578_cov_4.304003.p2 type:complete len:116 gc:universal NODE_243_length_2578_cov_4.304003:1279-932(-)